MDPEKSNDSGSAKIEESPPEKVLSSGIQLRASARVSKKLRLDQEALAQAPSPEKKNEPVVPNGVVPEEKRRRRAPVLWTAEEKAAFFEALNEHGKNFDAIEKHMINRAKKRGDGAAKNREKARHFYYRAWHKLSRYVHFPPHMITEVAICRTGHADRGKRSRCTGVKKVTQELYALINFGELRKKIGHITEKNAQKLNELIYSGRTQVRVRGKTWRIKTPVCRALRRLNNLGEDCEEIRLPTKVEVLLSPRANRDSTFPRVAGHNPRTRTMLSLDTTLSSLISFLKSRWSSSALKGDLTVGPKTNAVITQPQYKCGQAVTSGSVSLISHEQRSGGDPAEIRALLDQLHTGKAKGTIKKEKEGVSAAEEVANTEFIDPLVPEQQSTSSEQSSEQKEDAEKEEFCARAREGWTEESSGKTKIGQLYLMLGSKGVIELEYWWPIEDTQKELTKALQRLVSLARLYHFKAKVECPCGHKCKGSAKPSAGDSGKAVKRPPAANSKKNQASVDLPSASSQKVDVPKIVEDGGGTIEVPKFTPEMNQLVSGTFKHPLLPAPIKHHASTLDTLKQLQTFRPKYCNRRGRYRSRGLVVQRMLPILPKSSTHSQPLMVAVITSPSMVQTIPTSVCEVKEEKPVIKVHVGASTSLVSNTKETLLIKEGVETSAIAQTNTESPVEDPSLSTNTFKGILGGGGIEGGEVDDTPPTSPSRILKEGEGQWLNSEVTDFSLSSFLGHLESPLKSNGATTNDEIHMSTDVESHFLSLMTESSLDYTAKFADLAEKIAGSAVSHNS